MAIHCDIGFRWYCPACNMITRQVHTVSSRMTPWTPPNSLHSHPAALQTSTHPSVPPSIYLSISHKLRLGTVPLSQRRASEIERVSDFWRLLQCVSSDVSWGLTERQTQPLCGCFCFCLYLYLPHALSLPLSLSLSPSLMPLSVWRLIKRLPSQPPPHQPSSALLTISSLPQWRWRERESVHAREATHTIEMYLFICVLCVCVQFSVCILLCELYTTAHCEIS